MITAHTKLTLTPTQVPRHSMMTLRTLLIAILAVLFPTPSSSAQEKDKPALSIRALLLAPGGPSMSLHTLATESKKLSGPVLVGARGLSEPLAPGARSFAFVIPDKSKEDGHRSVASVVLPETGRDFIILLEPAGQTLKPHVVSAESPRFGNDSTLFFNATDVPIGATLGKNKVLVPPRRPVIAEAPQRGEAPWFQVTFYEPKDGQPAMIANTRWPHRNASRGYLFFYRSAPSGRISFQAVDETIEG